MSTITEYEQAQAAEWGKWVAVEAIDINGARAFNPGDPVPTSHVDGGIVRKSSVSGVNTKAAAAVAEEKN